MGCEALLTRKLRARGLRLTPQREMVLAAIHELSGHASVDEAYLQVRLRSTSVDKTTVYRTLELLQQLDLVKAADLGDNVLRYELTLHGPHCHLLCSRCGGLTTIEPVALRSLAEHCQGEFGFAMDLEHQVIRGLCPACQPGTARE